MSDDNLENLPSINDFLEESEVLPSVDEFIDCLLYTSDAADE